MELIEPTFTDFRIKAHFRICLFLGLSISENFTIFRVNIIESVHPGMSLKQFSDGNATSQRGKFKILIPSIPLR